MNREEVAKLMESSKSEQEWNNNCDAVKLRCGGYPPFWFEAINISGLASRVLASFGATDEIRITNLP